jgi:hypothetical protein
MHCSERGELLGRVRRAMRHYLGELVGRVRAMEAGATLLSDTPEDLARETSLL